MSDAEQLPDPLVPPDCDLRGFEWMPLDTVRLLDSDLVLKSSAEAFRAAVILWCRSWRQVPASSIPCDDVMLAKMSGAGPRWPKIKEAALRGFVLCSDGRMYHRVVAEKALQAWATRSRQRNAATMRWDKERHKHINAAAQPAHIVQTLTEQRREERSKEKKGAVDAMASGKQVKIEAFTLPDWIPKEAWDGWVAMRKKTNRPMTDRARDMAIAKLKAMKDGKHDVAAVLDQSTFRNWTDLYAVKTEITGTVSRNAAAAARFAAKGTTDG